MGLLAPHTHTHKIMIIWQKASHLSSTYLGVVPTHSSRVAGVGVKGIIHHFIVPPLNRARVICRSTAGKQVLPHRGEGALLGDAVSVVGKHALLCIVLSNLSQLIIPFLSYCVCMCVHSACNHIIDLLISLEPTSHANHSCVEWLLLIQQSSFVSQNPIIAIYVLHVPNKQAIFSTGS